ncbi:Hsp70 family protein [Pseudovibrio exalbescens]|uniref:Hsp70 family protein n=1 Tax=Pseudovibrio exalbescens TaxID=197461 RepID=UPI0023661486|nr:Hsp70 family protein [Pseudovibrio exalbescens]MDD7910877.1 Hsp70 family protein [Pseudovibrio exalbescens]
MTPTCAGIDFGTSNSTLGVFTGNGPKLVPVEGEATDIPTAIFFNFEEQETVFGRQARADYMDGFEGRLMRSLKSVLGSALIEEKTPILAKSVPFKEIIGIFLGHLKEKLTHFAGGDVSQVVMGRPVHFVDDDAEADRAAQNTLEEMTRAQGFSSVAFQYEPIAAALAYEQQATREEVVLVIDIGGGTADFSVVRVSPERAKAADRLDDILANTGVHIGGTDFDQLLSMAQVMPHMGYKSLSRDGKRPLPSKYYFELATWHSINRMYDPKILRELREVRREAAEPLRVDRIIDVVTHRQGHALAGLCEQAKIDLSDAAEVTVSLPLKESALSLPLTKAEFDAAINPSAERLSEEIDTALSMAGVTAPTIDCVFLTGGTTRVPLLQSMFRAKFPEAQIVEGDVFGAVGMGLALDAHRKFGS